MSDLTKEEMLRRKMAVEAAMLKRAGLSEQQIKEKQAAELAQAKADAAALAKAKARGDRIPKPPYRFAALNAAVYLPPGGAIRLDTPLAEGLSAVLTIRWRIETPLLIGETRNGVVHPLSLSKDGIDWVIPGASLRGMLRAAMEAVTLSRLRFSPKEGAKGPDRRIFLPSDHTVRKAPVNPDFTQRLFGYVYEPEEVDLKGGAPTNPADVARRSRIRFGFATPESGQTLELSREIETIQGAPRPGYTPFYFDRAINRAANPPSAQLAGRKRYLPRYPDLPSPENGLSQVTASAIEPIETFKAENPGRALPSKMINRQRYLVRKDSASPFYFTSDIRLENVTQAELGAVLWILTFGAGWQEHADASPYRHMIGRGRPFGAGQLAAAGISATLQRNASRETQERFAVNFEDRTRDHTVACARAAIDAFTTEMESAAVTAGLPSWAASESVIELLQVCDARLGAQAADDGDLSYPSWNQHKTLETRRPLSTGRYLAPEPLRRR